MTSLSWASATPTSASLFLWGTTGLPPRASSSVLTPTSGAYSWTSAPSADRCCASCTSSTAPSCTRPSRRGSLPTRVRRQSTLHRTSGALRVPPPAPQRLSPPPVHPRPPPVGCLPCGPLLPSPHLRSTCSSLPTGPPLGTRGHLLRTSRTKSVRWRRSARLATASPSRTSSGSFVASSMESVRPLHPRPPRTSGASSL